MKPGKRTAQSFKTCQEEVERRLSSFKKQPAPSQTATPTLRRTPIPQLRCMASLPSQSKDCPFSTESTVGMSREELQSLFS